MARIFISYRREDSEIWVGRLADELRKHFPREHIFEDVSSIDPGADFRTVLDEALATAAAMLVVIGRRWLSATDKQGRRRLEDPADLVRQEVSESLRRPGVRVFPLLVDLAEMPAEEDLPEPLKPLARREAFELTARHWTKDVAQLVLTLKHAPGLAELEERAAKEEEAKHRLPEEQHRAVADEETRRRAQAKAHRRSEEGRPGAATPPAPKSLPKALWKPLTVLGAVIGIAVLVFFARRKAAETETPPKGPPTVPAKTVASSEPGGSFPTRENSALRKTLMLPRDDPGDARRIFRETVDDGASILFVVLGDDPAADAAVSKAGKFAGEERSDPMLVVWVRRPDDIRVEIARLKESQAGFKDTILSGGARAFTTSFEGEIRDVIHTSEVLDNIRVVQAYLRAQTG